MQHINGRMNAAACVCCIVYWLTVNIIVKVYAYRRYFVLQNNKALNDYNRCLGNTIYNSLGTYILVVSNVSDDQTHVDSKPAGQAEQASLNQCQLIAAYSP